MRKAQHHLCNSQLVHLAIAEIDGFENYADEENVFDWILYLKNSIKPMEILLLTVWMKKIILLNFHLICILIIRGMNILRKQQLKYFITFFK